MEKGVYRKFFVKKNNLSFSTIDAIIAKHIQGNEIFEDGTLRVKDGDGKVSFEFSILDIYKSEAMDLVLMDRLESINSDLDRLVKLKSDLILLGIYEAPITINWYRY